MSDAMGLPGMPRGGASAGPLFLGARSGSPLTARPDGLSQPTALSPQAYDTTAGFSARGPSGYAAAGTGADRAVVAAPDAAEVAPADTDSETHVPGIAVPASLEKLLGFGRTFSWWPLLFGLACCAIEMMATAGPRYDLSRFGMEAMRASPRQADGMIVAGWCSTKMAPRVVRLYEQIPDPKWVLAMGSCAISGNIWDTYNIVQGVDALIPVDVYVPGCPPRPEALWMGLEMLRGRVKQSRHAYDGLRRIPARVAIGE